MAKLGVNIDHVATIRQARGGSAPDLAAAVRFCEQAGADSIVCHLREDRRHIQDQDVTTLKRLVQSRLNLEMSLARDIVDIACRVRPDQATLVPEKRRELTTEGGLDVVRYFQRVRRTVSRLSEAGIAVSLFIDPVREQIDAARDSGAPMIELHTGMYANAAALTARRRELRKLEQAFARANGLGLHVHAGHGLDYDNARAVADIVGRDGELNIGHSIVCRAVFDGLANAVREMKELVR